MRSSIVLVAGLVGLLGSSLVAAADPASTTTTTATPPDTASAGATPDDPNEIICKTMAPTTGTRIGARRECATRHQWDQQYQETQRLLQLQSSHGQGGVSPGG
jgi:hypothetical protein